MLGKDMTDSEGRKVSLDFFGGAIVVLFVFFNMLGTFAVEEKPVASFAPRNPTSGIRRRQ